MLKIWENAPIQYVCLILLSFCIKKTCKYLNIHHCNILSILVYCSAISSLTSNNGNIDFLSKIATLLFFDVIVLGIKNVLLMVWLITNVLSSDIQKYT